MSDSQEGPKRKVPSFLAHALLLWRLQFSMAGNRKGGTAMAVLAFVFSSAPTFFLAAVAYRLMQTPLIVGSAYWPHFILGLLSFVTTCMWALWPVLSAGVDDHSEVSRYASFPISPWRLLLASTAASLAEPRVLVFYGPLVGAALGYMRTHQVVAPWAVALAFFAYVFLNAALSRLGLYVVLNVLKQPRSAELLGGGFIAFLALASLIPPVDTSWLETVSAIGAAAVPSAIVANAAVALRRFPTGWFADSVSVEGWIDALADAMGLLEWGVLAMVLSYGLLIDFQRQMGRAGGNSRWTQRANPFALPTSAWRALLAKEFIELYNNPRARLLVSVPFVLAILLKITSARALLVFLFAVKADAVLLSGLCSYGALVMTATFSQNAFAYDGHGLALVYASPQRLDVTLLAKNVVHGLAGVALAMAVCVFYALYFRTAQLLDFAAAMSGVLILVPLLVAAGNGLSLVFPVKFHASLKRKDKVPLLASMLGIAAATLGVTPLSFVLRHQVAERVRVQDVAFLLLCAALSLAVWALTRPVVNWALIRRREYILMRVTRD